MFAIDEDNTKPQLCLHIHCKWYKITGAAFYADQFFCMNFNIAWILSGWRQTEFLDWFSQFMRNKKETTSLGKHFPTDI